MKKTEMTKRVRYARGSFLIIVSALVVGAVAAPSALVTVSHYADEATVSQRSASPRVAGTNKPPARSRPESLASLASPAGANAFPELDPSTASPLFAPIISATKVDSLFTDVNGNTKADPGDTLQYTVTISNTGPDPATNVNFTDTISTNTTLVAGSVNIGPIAGDDAYTTIGNTRLTVGFTSVGGASVAIPGQNIFDNDTEFLGDTFTVSAFQKSERPGR